MCIVIGMLFRSSSTLHGYLHRNPLQGVALRSVDAIEKTGRPQMDAGGTQ
jgi:hypothetical protein